MVEGACIVCGEPDPDGKPLGGVWLCRNCFREYCQEEEVAEAYAEPFLEAQGADYFLSWWWAGDAYLTQGEKLKAVKAFYWERQRQHPEEEKRARREYLREVFPEWENYLILGRLPRGGRAQGTEPAEEKKSGTGKTKAF